MGEYAAADNILERRGGVSLDDVLNESIEGEYWAAGPARGVLDHVEDTQKRNKDLMGSNPLFRKMLRAIQYHYGAFEGWDDWGDTAIQIVGEHGQVLSFALNYARYLVLQIKTLVTAEMPNYTTLPLSSDARSRVQARVGKRILNGYLTKKGLWQKLRETAEEALVTGTGFLSVSWNPAMGRWYDPDSGEPSQREGDVDYRVVPIEYVIIDWTLSSRWEDVPWRAIEYPVNRWDLAARFEESGEKIRGWSSGTDEETGRDRGVAATPEDDRVWLREFIHKPTDALPDGRYMLALKGDTEALLDIDSPYRGIQLLPCLAGRIRDCLLGWTVAFELQQPQELLCDALSKIATMQDNLGLPVLWTKTGTKQPDPQLWVGSIAWLESEEKPELVTLYDVPDELFKTIEFLIQGMERTAGLGPAVQGEAAGSVRANRMQLFMAEQSRRFNSDFESNFNSLFEEAGAATLELLQDFSLSVREVPHLSRSEEAAIISFTAEDLFDVAGVAVQAGNSLTRTLEGRLEVINLLAQNRVAVPKEEIISILNGAPLDTLTESAEGQVEVATAENEQIMAGGTHLALPTDNHLLHIKKHAAIFNTPAARQDSALIENALAACWEHLDMYNDLGHFEFQMALGYAEFPPSGGAQAPGGKPPAQGEEAAPAPPTAEEAI
ncbi:MAG: hypothetical protein JW940_04490 [Polyangiaceae bacterium]|nr:hypothetical protein [Polyangiaceae bacterium]